MSRASLSRALAAVGGEFELEIATFRPSYLLVKVTSGPLSVLAQPFGTSSWYPPAADLYATNGAVFGIAPSGFFSAGRGCSAGVSLMFCPAADIAVSDDAIVVDPVSFD